MYLKVLDYNKARKKCSIALSDQPISKKENKITVWKAPYFWQIISY